MFKVTFVFAALLASTNAFAGHDKFKCKTAPSDSGIVISISGCMAPAPGESMGSFQSVACQGQTEEYVTLERFSSAGNEELKLPGRIFNFGYVDGYFGIHYKGDIGMLNLDWYGYLDHPEWEPDSSQLDMDIQIFDFKHSSNNVKCETQVIE